MSIQTEQHACDKKPWNVMILRHEIDGRLTEWIVSLSTTAREGKASTDLYVHYCPYCGEALEK